MNEKGVKAQGFCSENVCYTATQVSCAACTKVGAEPALQLPEAAAASIVCLHAPGAGLLYSGPVL